MEHFFELPVVYKGEELTLNGRLVTFGYTYKFYIVVEGGEFAFEKDDEQQFRMLSSANVSEKHIDSRLIEVIIDALEKLTDT